MDEGDRKPGGEARPSVNPIVAWLGWGLALVLAVATVVQTVRLSARDEPRPRDQSRAGAAPGGSLQPGSPAAGATEAAPDGSPVAPAAPPPGEFVCTQVIGFSQTLQWFLAEPGFEQAVDGTSWQVLGDSAASIDRWADPAFELYSQPPLSPCAERSDNPDRVLITVSAFGGSRDPNQWVPLIERAVGVVQEKYPEVQQIVLQSVVGGPGDSECVVSGSFPVRASLNNPVIDQAISRVVGGDVVAGLSPEVRSCDDYRDRLGHLRDEAAGAIGRVIGEFYSGSGS